MSNNLKNYWAAKRKQYNRRAAIKDIKNKIRDVYCEEINSENLISYEQKFVSYAWDNFDPDAAAYLLSSSDTSYYRHNKILFQTLCIWMLSPKQTKSRLTKKTIAIFAAQALVQAERQIRRRDSSSEKIASLLLQLEPSKRTFIENIYEPIGGLKTILSAPSPGEWRRSIKEAAIGLYDVLRMVSLFHYSIECLSRDKYLPPSINKGKELLSALEYSPVGYDHPPRDKHGKRGGRTVHEYWLKFKPSVALLYAAANVIDGERSLLEATVEGRDTFSKYGGRLPEWLGKTKYIYDDILSKTSSPDGIRDIWYPTIDVPLVEIKVPQFSDKDRQQIADEFIRKRR